MRNKDNGAMNVARFSVLCVLWLGWITVGTLAIEILLQPFSYDHSNFTLLYCGIGAILFVISIVVFRKARGPSKET